MKTLKRAVSFLDKQGHRARLDVEITDRNGYPEFTVSGTYLSAGGQVIDEIKPANSAQRHLLELWKEYHLKDVSAVTFSGIAFDSGINSIMDAIEEMEEAREAEDKKEKEGDEKILANMEEEGIGEDMLDAVKAYIEAGIDGDDLRNFDEAYSGQFASDEDFAQNTAEELGEIDQDAKWPNNCIDWEQAARELMYDYTAQNGYYFRNI